MKKGEAIDLESGKSFVLPFTPVKSTGGKGSARKWPGITDEMWKQLFDDLQPYTTKERNEVCSKIGGKTYQTLNKTFGNNPTLGSKGVGSIGLTKKFGKAASDDPTVHLELINSKIAKYQEAIAELEEERVEVAKAAMAVYEEKMKEIKKFQRVKDAVDETSAM